MLYTDLYIKRAYHNLLSQLVPETTFFLGDLFDGGREWGTAGYESPEDQYKGYGQNFWLREYERFQNMFVAPWESLGLSTVPSENGRKIITSLPGNHDLGFAGGINQRVRSRFEAHFGPTNRIDVRGNHTFVSLDTVSLSAMDQVDIETGASGLGDKSASKNSWIWQPVEEYLNTAVTERERAVKHEVRSMGAKSSFPELRQAVQGWPPKDVPIVRDLVTLPANQKIEPDPLGVWTNQFPTIVLSHVPFYRSQSTDCGPYRERGTAIPVSAGYQYQNVLTPLISRNIVEKLDASQITQIYSGDDHDYCEIDHDEFTGRIKEITVKSTSWAMGIRKPAVQLVSLWNPVDLAQTVSYTKEGEPFVSGAVKRLSMPRGTVQNHMCMLPDQLGIFMTYGLLLAVTLASLLVRAVLWKPAVQHQSDLEDGLPLLRKSSTNGAKRAVSPPPRDALSVSSTLSPPSTTRRTGGYGNIPLEARSRTPSPSKARYMADSDDWGMPANEEDRKVYASAYDKPVAGVISRFWITRPARNKVDVLLKSLVHVGFLPVVLYFWFLWRDS